MRLSIVGLMILVLLSLALCSCSNRQELAQLRAEVVAAREEAAAANAQLKKLSSAPPTNTPASQATIPMAEKPLLLEDPPVAPIKLEPKRGGGEIKFGDSPPRRFVSISGVKGSQKGDLSFTYQKMPGELFFATVDRGELFIPVEKIAEIEITETSEPSNPQAEITPLQGNKLTVRYWILSTLVDVEWEGSIATERIHLAGHLNVKFDR